MFMVILLTLSWEYIIKDSMKILPFIAYLIICFFSLGEIVSAKVYLCDNLETGIKSVNIKKNIAVIQMKNYSVKVPLKIMKGKNFQRANGYTPQGMAIGLKYNDVVLQLLAIDKAKKNYMVVHLIAQGAKQNNRPLNYKNPVTADDIYVSSIQYIQSYPLWGANNVMRGFDLLTQKERHIIQLFPAIRLEIADKLCRSDDVSSGIFELLPSHEKINCDTLEILSSEDYLKKLQNLASQERPLLVQILECSQGIKHPKICQAINKKLADKVLKTITTQAIINKIKQ
jgi:hypothetical protein